MSEPAIFSLGPKGIITAPEELMRMLFMHAFEADHSQSTMHQESVFSFQWLAAMHGHDPAEFSQELETGLQRYFGRYFPEGTDVSVEEIDPGERTRYWLRIDISVTHKGIPYQLGDRLYRDNSQDIIKLEAHMP